MKKTGQKIISAGLVALSVFFVGALSADAELVKLYDPGDLGHYLPTPPHYYALSDANWSAHYGTEATLCDATNWADGWVLGSSNLMADGANAANKFRETPGFLWTVDFEATAPVGDLATIDTRWDNTSADDVFHLGLLVGSDWFVSEDVFGGSGVTWHRLDADDLGSMNWWILDFDPGSTMDIDTSQTFEFSALSGDVSGIGYYFDDGITNRVRTRNTEVYAIPEPVTFSILGVGTLLLFVLRRFVVV